MSFFSFLSSVSNISISESNITRIVSNSDFSDDISRVKKIDSELDSDSDDSSTTYSDINDDSIDDQSTQNSESASSTMNAITVELQILRKKLQINKLKLKAEKLKAAVRKKDVSQTSSVTISKTKTPKPNTSDFSEYMPPNRYSGAMYPLHLIRKQSHLALLIGKMMFRYRLLTVSPQPCE